MGKTYMKYTRNEANFKDDRRKTKYIANSFNALSIISRRSKKRIIVLSLMTVAIVLNILIAVFAIRSQISLTQELVIKNVGVGDMNVFTVETVAQPTTNTKLGQNTTYTAVKESITKAEECVNNVAMNSQYIGIETIVENNDYIVQETKFNKSDTTTEPTPHNIEVKSLTSDKNAPLIDIEENILEHEHVFDEYGDCIGEEGEKCDATTYTKWLDFQYIDGEQYELTGIGAATSCDIIIPSYYGRLPVTSIAPRAFFGCTNLTSVVVPDTVTTIENSAFNRCTNLTSVTIGNSVTKIGNSAFHGCSSLTSVIIGSSVANIGYGAFSNCCNLTAVAIPNSVTTIESDAFLNCSSLTAITLGNSLINIGYEAFKNCETITTLSIPSSVINIGRFALSGCNNLTSLIVESGNAKYHSAGNCLIETASQTLIAGCKNSTIPTDGSATKIGIGAFRNCSSLTSIAIPNNITSIEDCAFSGCTSLRLIKSMWFIIF